MKAQVPARRFLFRDAERSMTRSTTSVINIIEASWPDRVMPPAFIQDGPERYGTVWYVLARRGIRSSYYQL